VLKTKPSEAFVAGKSKEAAALRKAAASSRGEFAAPFNISPGHQ
jgi:hypothetical protein